MAERKPISKRTRFDVFKRDGFTCQYCGAQPPGVVLELDHVHPVSLGGDSGEINLTTSCNVCNSGKSNKLLGDRAVRPDADEAYLRVQQELAEAKRYLQAKDELSQMEGELKTHVLRTWQEHLGGWTRPDDSTLSRWINYCSPEEIDWAIMKLAERARSFNFRLTTSAVIYVNSLLRNLERND